MSTKENVEKLEHCALLKGMYSGAATMENSSVVPSLEN